MNDRSYSKEDIHRARGNAIASPDPDTSFFLGPTSESDEVYAFAHKLDALLFLKGYFGDYLAGSEQNALQTEIKKVEDTGSDAGTGGLSDILDTNDTLDIFAEGYWEEFVERSVEFWPEWAENFLDTISGSALWDDLGDTDPDFDIPEDSVDAFDNPAGHFLFSEPPEDVYHAEFVERLLNIIPFAT
ncbi:hypothetical protein D3OALGB2SA_142 [Olavius algarvensis associated proteobacterium Delta 3]|nr:hypothetical protein D3OALGB2SA_142 [Olavius algarvensis associated proteobacterium Delta 3]